MGTKFLQTRVKKYIYEAIQMDARNLSYVRILHKARNIKRITVLLSHNEILR